MFDKDDTHRNYKHCAFSEENLTRFARHPGWEQGMTEFERWDYRTGNTATPYTLQLPEEGENR